MVNPGHPAHPVPLVARLHREAFRRDARGNLHIDVPRILAIVGWPDTPKHREILAQLATESARELYPGVEVQIVEHL